MESAEKNGDVRTLSLIHICTKSIENYEQDIQYAYDTLGLAEYVASRQARTNRYMEAIGHAAYEG